MGLKDLVVAPLFLVLIYFAAYFVRHLVTDKQIRRYFIPALTVKLLGALAIGLIYQYYYDGGDTYSYFTHGSELIYEAWQDNPIKAYKLITADGTYELDTYEYASKIWLYRDQTSYFVIRVAAIFDIFTFHTYSATAFLFAIWAFSGSWAMFLVFYRLYPELHKLIAISIFFVPSVILWGSGLLKDTLTFGAVGWLTYAFYYIVLRNRFNLSKLLIGLLAIYILFEVKIYILLSVLPALLLWWSVYTSSKVSNPFLRASITPVLLVVSIVFSYFVLTKIGEGNARYSIEKVSKTAEATARWLNYVSTVEGGAGYTLGDYDFSPAGIIRKSPMAITVTLYRPFLWESNNILMLFSSLESTFTLLITLFVLFRVGLLRFLRYAYKNPEAFFCLVFSIVFAFAIGISTYNFGSLVRYKIPMLPFYFISLSILYYGLKRKNKVRPAVIG